MIHLSGADDISSMSADSCWLSSLAGKYYLFWTIISYVAWYLGALVAQWLALLTSDLEGPGSNPG
jgi:hypothetical protein